MSEKEIKTNEPLNKLLAALVDNKSINTEKRTADFVITTDGVDRDGDIMDPMGMDTTHYEKNPTVLTFHNYNSFPVGKVINIKKTKKNVRATVEFVPAGVLPEADISWKLVELGFLKTVSIGFLPNYDTIERPENMKRNGQRVYRIIRNYELMELSLVPVPSNRDALAIKEAAKDGKLSEKDMDFLKSSDFLNKKTDADEKTVDTDEKATEYAGVSESVDRTATDENDVKVTNSSGDVNVSAEADTKDGAAKIIEKYVEIKDYNAEIAELKSQIAELKAQIDEIVTPKAQGETDATDEETKMIEGEDDFFKALLDGDNADGNNILDNLVSEVSGSTTKDHTEDQIDDNDNLLDRLV